MEMESNCFMKFVLIFSIPYAIGDTLDERFHILYSDALKCDHNKSLNLMTNDLKIYFYDFINNINVSGTIDKAVAQIAPFIKNSERKIVFFVPGYKCSIHRDIEEWIRQTFKDVTDVYLVIVDHSAYTYESEDKLGSYSRSVLYSYYIGDALGKLLVNFTREGLSAKKIHGVGHSLGGQMLSYAGDTYFRETSQRIRKITGLDPAGPCFNNSAKEDQIRSGVAEYVEVYHCNAGHLGTTNNLADVDFIFNKNGKIQPGCEGLKLEDTAKCYHKACVKFWTATVQNPNLYLARSCHSYEAFVKGLCTETETAIAGYFNSENATGLFYVSTDNCISFSKLDEINTITADTSTVTPIPSSTDFSTKTTMTSAVKLLVSD